MALVDSAQDSDVVVSVPARHTVIQRATGLQTMSVVVLAAAGESMAAVGDQIQNVR